VSELIREEGNPNLKLRVFVSAAAAPVSSTDSRSTRTRKTATPASRPGVRLLVDPMSFQYLTGAEIDYREDLEGAQFVIAIQTPRPPAGAGRRLHLMG